MLMVKHFRTNNRKWTENKFKAKEAKPELLDDWDQRLVITTLENNDQGSRITLNQVAEKDQVTLLSFSNSFHQIVFSGTARTARWCTRWTLRTRTSSSWPAWPRTWWRGGSSRELWSAVEELPTGRSALHSKLPSSSLTACHAFLSTFRYLSFTFVLYLFYFTFYKLNIQLAILRGGVSSIFSIVWRREMGCDGMCNVWITVAILDHHYWWIFLQILNISNLSAQIVY